MPTNIFPRSNDFLVNTLTPGEQTRPELAPLANGGYVATWLSDGEVRGRLFDSLGQPVSVEGSTSDFLIDSGIPFPIQGRKSVAGLADGGFVVAWAPDAFHPIEARIFNAAGVPTGDAFSVFSFSGILLGPSVAPLANGGFFVTATASGPIANPTDIWARVFDASGQPVSVGGSTNNFLVNTTTAGAQTTSNVVALANDGIIATWISQNEGTFEIRGRLFDANANPVNVNGSTDDFLISTPSEYSQRYQHVVALSGGGFVVTWVSELFNPNPTQDVTRYEFRGKVFDAAGQSVTASEIVLNTNLPAGTLFNDFTAVTALSGGGFVVSMNNSATYLRIYDSSGDPVSVNGSTDPFRAATALQGGGLQHDSQLTPLENGGFVVVWSGQGRNGDLGTSFDTIGAAFDANGSRLAVNGSTEPFLIGTTTTGFQELPAISTLEDGSFVVTWISSDSGTDRDIRSRVFEVQENTIPVITSDGGGDTAALNVAENTTAVTTVVAFDPEVATQTNALVFSIVPVALGGAADAGLFQVDRDTGVLSFAGAPDFENPADANGDNIYEVAVQVDDGNFGIDTQTIRVTVTDVQENAAPTAVADTASVTEDAVLTASGNVLANDSDPDNDLLTVASVNGAAALVGTAITGSYGTLRLNGNGSYSYALDNASAAVQLLQPGTPVADAFSYTTSDGHGGTATTTLTIVVNGAADNIVVGATNGANTLPGTAGNDVILALGGADLANGGNGNDFIDGGDGGDTLNGGSGDDILVGGNEADELNGNGGNDWFRATNGDGNDTYSGGGGTDTYDLSLVDDGVVVNLDAGTSSGGQTGTDTLTAIENVIGSRGADVITASNAQNVLTGGDGADTFVFLRAGTTGSGATRDRITDFQPGTDRIDVSGIDANASTTVNDAFVFSGQITNVINGLGQLARGQLGYRFETDANGAQITVVEGNFNQNAAADFQISLTGWQVLTQGDFIL